MLVLAVRSALAAVALGTAAVMLVKGKPIARKEKPAPAKGAVFFGGAGKAMVIDHARDLVQLNKPEAWFIDDRVTSRMVSMQDCLTYAVAMHATKDGIDGWFIVYAPVIRNETLTDFVANVAAQAAEQGVTLNSHFAEDIKTHFTVLL